MAKIIDLYFRALKFLVALCLASMVALVFGNVVLRYVFSSGITFSEEFSRWLFVWLTFFGAIVAWLFIVVNGHLLVVAALGQSFAAFPVGPEPFAFVREMQPQRWGAEVFSMGLWIALPMVTMLLFVNIALGTISRVAPQINIFAIGFPVTLGLGLLGLLLTLPMLAQPFTIALERLLEHFR